MVLGFTTLFVSCLGMRRRTRVILFVLDCVSVSQSMSSFPIETGGELQISNTSTPSSTRFVKKSPIVLQETNVELFESWTRWKESKENSAEYKYDGIAHLLPRLMAEDAKQGVYSCIQEEDVEQWIKKHHVSVVKEDSMYRKCGPNLELHINGGVYSYVCTRISMRMQISTSRIREYMVWRWDAAGNETTQEKPSSDVVSVYDMFQSLYGSLWKTVLYLESEQAKHTIPAVHAGLPGPEPISVPLYVHRYDMQMRNDLSTGDLCIELHLHVFV